MPPIWKPQSNEILRYWIDTIINEASDNLNEWEMKFIEDMCARIDLKISLTQAQEAKLEQIYANKTK